jgi:uncharacterized RDD family membrane protein YckC
MENISIQTSQNIAIQQTVASVGERIAAAGLDYLFYFVYFMIISILSGIAEKPAVMGLLMVPVVFYHLISEASMQGQSWGKKIVKIKVVKIDGTQAGFMAYLIRWLFRLVDIGIFFGGLSVLVIILNGKGQRLGDIVANTTVVRLREQSFNETIYTKLPDDYSLVFSQVNKLTDTDLYTAKEVLDFMNRSKHSYESQEMAIKAKKALELKMGIQSDLLSGKFLVTVIRDYNFIHTR